MKQIAIFTTILFLSFGTSFSQINLDSSLVAYYPLDSIPIDYSSYGIQGTIFNGAVSDTGKNNFPNTAYHFNGSNQYIDCNTNLRGITDKVSVSAWFKTTTSSHCQIVSKYHGGGTVINKGFHLAINNGRAYFAGRTGIPWTPGYHIIYADERPINDGTWHHALGTIDQNEWNLWVDGMHINTLTTTDPNPSLICPPMPLAIGYYPEMQSSYFDGTIDEVRVYNRILNSAEISLLSNPSFIDSSYLIQPDTHLISMPVGWSIFSTYINPVVPSMDSLMAGIVSSIIIVKDGNGLIYWPLWSLNSIGSLNFLNGYQIKLMAAQTLQVIGTKVQPELYTIPLPQGWGIIGYLRDTSYPIETIFSNISGSVRIVKNGIGQMYWPAFNLNLIGNMQPGQGYQIRMYSSQNLVYPAN